MNLERTVNDMDKIEKMFLDLNGVLVKFWIEQGRPDKETKIALLERMLSWYKTMGYITLDTLSEEPVCLYDGGAPSKQKCGDCTIACSIRIEEESNKDLEKAADRFANTQNKNFLNPEIVKNIFIAGAKWQEKLDEETIKTAEDHAFLAGADWQEEQMMKRAMEGYVNYYEDSGGILMAEAQVGYPYHNGDKVKLIVIKED